MASEYRLRCQIAEKFGGWPHEVGKFPLRYFRKLGRVLVDEHEAIEKLRAEASKDPNAIEIDPTEFSTQESFKGEAV